MENGACGCAIYFYACVNIYQKLGSSPGLETTPVCTIQIHRQSLNGVGADVTVLSYSDDSKS